MESVASLVQNRPQVVVRAYRGKSRSAAAQAMATDAAALSKAGYAPTTETWAGGEYSPIAYIGALLLAIFLIGIIIFILMLIVQPDGTLTVRYEYVGAARVVQPEPAPALQPVMAPAPAAPAPA